MSRHPGKTIHRRTISAVAFLLGFIFIISISLAGGLIGPGGTSAASKQSQAVRLEAALVSLRRTSPPSKQAENVSVPQDQDDVVKVSTDLVVVNATVLDKEGKFVPRLKRTDFQVFEDGAEQRLLLQRGRDAVCRGDPFGYVREHGVATYAWAQRRGSIS